MSGRMRSSERNLGVAALIPADEDNYSDTSAAECFFRVHGSPTLARSAYQPKGRSANSARLGSRSMGGCKQEITGPPPSDILSPKNCHAQSSASCETYVTASVPLWTASERNALVCGSSENFQSNKLLVGSVEIQKSVAAPVVGA